VVLLRELVVRAERRLRWSDVEKELGQSSALVDAATPQTGDRAR
jgi:hypothetical protein